MSRPHPMGDERQHLILLRTMAARTGADTALAFEEGSLSQEDWADAVTRCRNCGWVDGCRSWLAQPQEDRRSVPGDCANARMLRALQLPG